MTPKEFSTRTLSQYYSIALLLIACLALASHLVQSTATRNIEGMARIINVSGRQRMLSQRIASLVAQYRLGDPDAKQALQNSIAEFESAHQRLSRGDLAFTSSAADTRLLQELYFQGPHSVDAEMASFLADARSAASLPADDPGMAAISARIFAEAKSPLLDALDQVVLRRQQESDTKFQRLRLLQIGILMVMLLSLTLEARFIFRPMVKKILEFGSEILRVASTDALTGVANRRGFFARCNVELARAKRHRQPMSLLMVDADRFKEINDAYGHPAGDATLAALSQSLVSHLRPSDVVGRVGGEEFAILLPQTDASGAAVLAERLRRGVEELRIQESDRTITLSISIGVAQVDVDSPSIDSALQMADRLLYRAKAAGRNRVELESAA